MTNETQQKIDKVLGPKNWKNVGVAKLAESGRSIVLEIGLKYDIDKPAYIGLAALTKLLSGEYHDATIYQIEGTQK